MITGYKAFNNNKTNRYGKTFEENKIYKTTGQLRFGVGGNGFHFCKNLEDTLRYFPAMEEEIIIAEIIAIGNIKEYNDEYYGFYNMYCTDQIIINKFLTHKEIIENFINMSKYEENRICRFISLFHLNQDEILLFKDKFKDSKKIINCIEYYQENKKDVYNNEYKIHKLIK